MAGVTRAANAAGKEEPAVSEENGVCVGQQGRTLAYISKIYSILCKAFVRSSSQLLVAHIQTYCSGVCKVVLPWIGWGGVLRQAECMPVVHHSVVNVPFVHARQR